MMRANAVIRMQGQGHRGGFWCLTLPTCLHGHVRDVHKTCEKFLGNPHLEYTHLLDSAKLLVAVKMHQNQSSKIVWG